MKVKIYTEGGSGVGFGHLSRCASLYDELRERNADVKMIVHGDIQQAGFLQGKTLVNQNWMDKAYLSASLEPDDYVIVDSYLASREIYDLIASIVQKAVFIDDTGRIEYPRGIIVNPALDAKGIEYGKDTDRVLSGPEYVIVRSAFVTSSKADIPPMARRAFVIMGGTDVRNLTAGVMDSVCRANEDMDFDVVVSPSQYESLDSMLKLGNVHLHTNVSEVEMSRLMARADLAITAAGQTIHELMVTRTPFIAVQVADNQKNNIEAVSKFISPEVVLNCDQPTFYDSLLQHFSKMKSYEFRREISGRMASVVDGKGRKRIIDALFGISVNTDGIYLRKAQNEDMHDVFELSNEDFVRRYSINPNKIQWNDHVTWFNRVLSDENVVFYVATDQNGGFYGQIRYNLDRSQATVSISLSGALRGKGLSKRLLNESIGKLLEERPQIEDVVAYVSERNRASMKIFSGLNFKWTGSENELNRLVLKRSEYNGD